MKRENIAVKESQKLKIPIFAMVDTNSDPRGIDYPIPSNDDASKAIRKILTIIVGAIKEGLELRQNEKDTQPNLNQKIHRTVLKLRLKRVEQVKPLTLKIKTKRKKKINNLLIMKITAAEVNDLRKSTGAGMMDCKKALVEAHGDHEKAIEILKKDKRLLQTELKGTLLKVLFC